MDRDQGLRWLKTMIRIRRLEEACAEQYSAGKIRGFLHLYIGEEAIATAVMDALSSEDPVFCTYREHGHALARGLSMGSIMAEMFGKVDGCSGGRGGSMHLFSKAHNFFGGNAIVASHLPVAAGVGLGFKMQNRPAIAVAFFGEGAIAEGEYHEAMNLAGLWRIPVLFVCENNLYAMGTALERSESQTDLCAKAASYGVKTMSCDGMDVAAVAEVAAAAIRSVRELREPVFLECRTYRFRAHSMFDAELYRDKEEVERWKERDPIDLLTARLQQDGGLTEEDLAAIYAAASAEVADAIAFAEQSPLEPVDQLGRHVYSERSHANE